MGVVVAGVAVHYFAVRVKSFDLDVLVEVGHAVEVAILGDGTVCGLEGRCCALDECAEGEVVEDFTAISGGVSMSCAAWMIGDSIPPHVYAPVLPQALIVEAVYSRYLSRLVVAANECDAIWVSYFEAKKEEEGLEGVETTVNEVACVIVSFTLSAYMEHIAYP
jgi:hypothetical protein